MLCRAIIHPSKTKQYLLYLDFKCLNSFLKPAGTLGRKCVIPFDSIGSLVVNAVISPRQPYDDEFVV